MRLVFSGHDRTRTRQVRPEELGTHCQRHGNTGCFQHHGSWSEQNDVLTVTFRPTIYLNSSLTGSARQQALAHEQRHAQDFQRRARQLHRAVTAALRQGADPNMANRWNWFLYDLCADSAAYHRSIGATVEICLQPSGSRP